MLSGLRARRRGLEPEEVNEPKRKKRFKTSFGLVLLLVFCVAIVFFWIANEGAVKIGVTNLTDMSFTRRDIVRSWEILEISRPKYHWVGQVKDEVVGIWVAVGYEENTLTFYSDRYDVARENHSAETTQLLVKLKSLPENPEISYKFLMIVLDNWRGLWKEYGGSDIVFAEVALNNYLVERHTDDEVEATNNEARAMAISEYYANKANALLMEKQKIQNALINAAVSAAALVAVAGLILYLRFVSKRSKKLLQREKEYSQEQITTITAEQERTLMRKVRKAQRKAAQQAYAARLAGEEDGKVRAEENLMETIREMSG